MEKEMKEALKIRNKLMKLVLSGEATNIKDTPEEELEILTLQLTGD